jgi:hypothetical protein
VSFYETPDGTIWVEFQFANGEKSPKFEYEKIIHIRKNYSGANDFLGGNSSGNPDYDPLMQTLKLNDKLLKGVGKGIEVSFAVNGIVKTNTYLDDDKHQAEIEKFEKHLNSSENGILSLDLGGDYIPISRNIQFADSTLLKWIDEKILRTFGVSLPILTGDYTKAQKEAFYQKTLEGDIIVIEQAFTKGIFSKEERRNGNYVSLFYDKLMFLTPEEIASFITEAGGRGALTNNQILGFYGLPPYEGGDIRMASLNYINAEVIDAYQLGKKGGKNEVQ